MKSFFGGLVYIFHSKINTFNNHWSYEHNLEHCMYVINKQFQTRIFSNDTYGVC